MSGVVHGLIEESPNRAFLVLPSSYCYDYYPEEKSSVWEAAFKLIGTSYQEIDHICVTRTINERLRQKHYNYHELDELNH